MFTAEGLGEAAWEELIYNHGIEVPILLIEGRVERDVQIMWSLLRLPYPPLCCQNCWNLDSDHNEYRGEIVYFCQLNIMFPIKKLTCKRQAKREKEYGFKSGTEEG